MHIRCCPAQSWNRDSQINVIAPGNAKLRSCTPGNYTQEAAALFTVCGKPDYLALPMVPMSVMNITILDGREIARNRSKSRRY
jgi:hypothetical protein